MTTHQLVKILKFRGLDGWFVNIESEIKPQHLYLLKSFVSHLIQQAVEHSEVIRFFRCFSLSKCYISSDHNGVQLKIYVYYKRFIFVFLCNTFRLEVNNLNKFVKKSYENIIRLKSIRNRIVNRYYLELFSSYNLRDAIDET